MADDEKKTLPKEEALDLADKGKDAWNEWAANNPGVNVDFSDHDFSGAEVSFDGFIFPGDVSFARAEFSRVSFSETKFKGKNVSFDYAVFKGFSTVFKKTEFDCEFLSFTAAKFRCGHTRFTGTVFNGEQVSFGQAEFSGRVVMFNDSTFQASKVFFDKAEFTRVSAGFRGVEFHGSVHFSRTIFPRACNFEGVIFKGPVNLEGVQFHGAPDFRRTTFSTHFTLHGMKVYYATNLKKVWRIFTKASTEFETDKFRRLKDLALQARDHEREQDFFSKELKAKRFYETTGFSLIPSYLYEWTSDFGRSLWRPVLCLFMTWLVFGLLYGVNGLKYAPSPLEPLWNGLKLSLATLVPFAAISRTAMLEAREALFKSDVNHWLDFAMIFEGILAIVFIFLIGLALRNRFRI